MVLEWLTRQHRCLAEALRANRRQILETPVAPAFTTGFPSNTEIQMIGAAPWCKRDLPSSYNVKRDVRGVAPTLKFY